MVPQPVRQVREEILKQGVPARHALALWTDNVLLEIFRYRSDGKFGRPLLAGALMSKVPKKGDLFMDLVSIVRERFPEGVQRTVWDANSLEGKGGIRGKDLTEVALAHGSLFDYGVALDWKESLRL